jgi:hypothetical protein
MKKVRIATVLGLVGFVYHLGFAIWIFNLNLPEGTDSYGNLAFPAGGFTPLFGWTMAITILPFGLAYLLAALDPAASRSLLIVVTSWKVLSVLGMLAAIFSGIATSYTYGWVIMDGIFALVGIYAVVVTRKQKGD